jgi:hypothetical protein
MPTVRFTFDSNDSLDFVRACTKTNEMSALCGDSLNKERIERDLSCSSVNIVSDFGVYEKSQARLHTAISTPREMLSPLTGILEPT